MDKEDEQKDKQKDKQRKNKEQKWKIIASTLGRIISRQKRNKDPVVRYSLLVNNICLGLEGLITYMEMKSEDMSEEVAEKMRTSSSILTNELYALFEWIQSPQYGPDHPFGNSVMKQTKQDFEVQVSNLNETNANNDTAA